MSQTKDAGITIREALPADGPALVEAIGRIDEETEFLGTPGEYRRWWADGGAARIAALRERGTGVYLVALSGGETVGFLGAFPGAFAATRGILYIGHVGLRRAWRGHGIGTLLFAAIEDWARRNGAWRLDLRVDEANERGLALYRKQGFAIEGRIAQSVKLADRWHAHYWMAKALRELDGPAWQRLDPAPQRPALSGAVTIRSLRPEDARLLCAWERRVLGEVPFALKDVPLP